MAGGSADAAAHFKKAMRELYKNDISDDELMGIRT